MAHWYFPGKHVQISFREFGPMAKSSFPAVLIFLLVCFCAIPGSLANGSPQESARDLGDQKSAGKFLTLGEIDTWALDADKNEILIVKVTTNQFDAVIGLAKVKNEKDEVLFSKDQKGSNSNFCHRITSAGKYKIRVHGYEMKGGGNYQLSVQRFNARPIRPGKTVTTVTGKNGHANFFFDGKSGQWITLVGAHGGRLYDPDGNIVQPKWAGSYLIPRDGEYLVHSQHIQESTASVEVRPAVVGSLKSRESQSYKSKRGTLHNWEIDAQKGQFELITVSRKKNPSSRIIFSPPNDPNEKRLDARKESGPELMFLPVASKGKFTTYAVVFGRTGKFLLQTHTHFSDSNINIEMKDPTVDLSSNTKEKSRIKIGGAAYYGFDATAGDLVKFDLRSEAFDSVLLLFDGTGSRVIENDDFGDSTNCQIEYLVTRSDYYRWQVMSLGNGGGGEYEFDFVEIPKQKIAIGESTSSEMDRNSKAYWALEGEAEKSVIVNIRSSQFSPEVQVYDSSGRQIASNSRGVRDEQLVAFQIPRDGRVTMVVSSRGSGGEYRIRAIDADWDDAK